MIVVPLAIQGGKMVAKRYVKRKLVRVAAERAAYQRAGMGGLYNAYKTLYPATPLKKEIAEWAIGAGIAVVAATNIVAVSVAMAPHLHPRTSKHIVGPQRDPFDARWLVA